MEIYNYIAFKVGQIIFLINVYITIILSRIVYAKYKIYTMSTMGCQCTAEKGLLFSEGVVFELTGAWRISSALVRRYSPMHHCVAHSKPQGVHELENKRPFSASCIHS